MTLTLSDIYQSRVAQGLIKPDPAQAHLLVHLETRRAWLEKPLPRSGFLGRRLFAKAPPPPRGLYIWGGVGRGKSMLMDLFFGVLNIPGKRRVHFHAFMQEVQTGLAEARRCGVDDALAPVAQNIAKDLRVLAFDEMQITDITDAMLVGRLFQMLFAAGVMIVATSNRPPDDLYKNGLNRALFVPFIAQLKERMDVVELASANDHRQNRLSGSEVYFFPADIRAQRALDAIWDDLTGGAAETPLALQVKGRAVTLRAFHNGVARCDFRDLCALPLGPADYLALADTVRVLILENIPLLSGGNHNEAKRFVTLIDALYEARVRLVASAADSADRLYPEGVGSFEFVRTARRLAEMQSADWADADAATTQND